MNATPLTLDTLPGTYAVVRLPPDAPPPEWASGGSLTSVTHTPEETSIVCEDHRVPETAHAERGFRALRVQGRLDFSQVGVLASLALPLAEAGISIFCLSTFDTDYLLLPAGKLADAAAALEAAGHKVLVGDSEEGRVG